MKKYKKKLKKSILKKKTYETFSFHIRLND
jgi:hypothetical protein